jgi:Astacin (Peptidase family M12A).
LFSPVQIQKIKFLVSAYWNDFGKASPKDVSDYGVPYDFQSVMHYPAKAFSKNGKDTIVAKVSEIMK